MDPGRTLPETDAEPHGLTQGTFFTRLAVLTKAALVIFKESRAD